MRGQYERLLDLSELVLIEARNGEWEKMMERNQTFLLAVDEAKTHIASPLLSHKESERQQAVLVKLTTNTEQINQIISSERKRVSALMGDATRQKNVNQAYCGITSADP